MQKHYWSLNLNSNGALVFYNWRNDGADTDGKHTTGSSLINEDTWYYVAATWDGSVSKIYVNGDNKTFTDASTLTFSTTHHAIGLLKTHVNYAFAGNIREVRIWNKTCTQSDLQQTWKHTITT